MDNQPVSTPPQNEFKTKWRNFPPTSRITIQNPFDHDVLFQVADERNQPYQYRIRAGQRAELPGGAIATLGVKAIVDELIQNNKDDVMRMWDENVRAKHEEDIIILNKETKPHINPERPGEIDLTAAKDSQDEALPAAETAPEQPFPGLNESKATIKPSSSLPTGVSVGLDDVVQASLPKQDAVTNPNNAHADAEG